MHAVLLIADNADRLHSEFIRVVSVVSCETSRLVSRTCQSFVKLDFYALMLRRSFIQSVLKY